MGARRLPVDCRFEVGTGAIRACRSSHRSREPAALRRSDTWPVTSAPPSCLRGPEAPHSGSAKPAGRSRTQPTTSCKGGAMDLPKVVSSGEWDAAQEAFRAKEKAATSARDALAAERRRLPRLLIEKEYTLEGPAGEVSLAELFEGRRQLLLYHFMFGPNQSEGCDGCSMVVDGIADLAHLHARDTSFALVSRAPIEKLE